MSINENPQVKSSQLELGNIVTIGNILTIQVGICMMSKGWMAQ